MPDLKISQLPAASTPLAGTELVPIVQGGTTDQTTVQAILTSAVPSGTANGVLYLNGSKVVTSGSGLTFDGTNLGVGTTNPSSLGKLAVAATTGTVALYAGSSTQGVYISNSTGTEVVYNASGYSGGVHVWQTGNNEQMRLTSTGLGIGTSSPSTKLYVTVSAASTACAAFFNTDTANGNGLYVKAGGANSGKYALAVENAAGTSLAYLDSSGNLGLGVTPSAWGGGYKALQVTRGASLGSNDANSFVLGQNWYYNGTSDFYITSNFASAYQQVNGIHKWLTAPSWDGTGSNAISFTQAMTLDASGNLSIGTTSVFNSTGGRGNLSLNGSSSAMYNLGVNNASAGYVYHSGTDMWINNVLNGIMSFYTNNQERARIPAAGGMVVGTAALATTATDGFLYVPTCAGTPTGTPTTQTGTAPIVVDTTNNKLYFYSGGQWRDAGP